jgi:integrase
MRPLDAAGLRALVDAADGQLARALLVTAAMTGMRRGELLGLRWRDVDYTNRRVWVRRSIGLGGVVKQPKTARSVRAIALPRMVADELEAHWKASPFRAPDDYVFTNSIGTPLDGRSMVREVFEPARVRAKLPPVRFHDLRHSYASVLIEQGAHPKVISDQLGHASVQITMDRYSHLFDGAYSDVNDELERAWEGAEGRCTLTWASVPE